MRERSKRHSKQPTSPTSDPLWQEMRSHYQSVDPSERLTELLHQIPDRVANPIEEPHRQSRPGPWFNIQLSPGQWVVTACFATLLFGCGLGVIFMQLNDTSSVERTAATDSNESLLSSPDTPGDSSQRDSTDRQSQPVDSHREDQASHAPKHVDVSTELAVARLVADRLNERRRDDIDGRLRQLREERLSREESWDRVAATLTYVAEFETKENRARIANSTEPAVSESPVSPLYQVVIDLSPSSRWSEQAKEMLGQMQ